MASVHSGVAVIELTDLLPATDYEIRISGVGEPVSFTTRPDVGEVLARFATVSDIHIGLESFGILGRLKDVEKGQTLRSATAAIGEAHRWGAGLLAVKGDITQNGTADEWAKAPLLLNEASSDLDVIATAGNHDVKKTRDVEAGEGIATMAAPFESVQLRAIPGATVALVDTSINEAGHGQILSLIHI